MSTFPKVEANASHEPESGKSIEVSVGPMTGEDARLILKATTEKIANIEAYISRLSINFMQCLGKTPEEYNKGERFRMEVVMPLLRHFDGLQQIVEGFMRGIKSSDGFCTSKGLGSIESVFVQQIFPLAHKADAADSMLNSWDQTGVLSSKIPEKCQRQGNIEMCLYTLKSLVIGVPRPGS